jgi:hypothetical protein
VLFDVYNFTSPMQAYRQEKQNTGDVVLQIPSSPQAMELFYQFHTARQANAADQLVRKDIDANEEEST